MSKNEPLDKELYDKLKKEIWEQYKVPSAYRSAQLVKRYKEAEPPLIHEEKKNIKLFGRTVVELNTIEENISQD